MRRALRLAGACLAGTWLAGSFPTGVVAADPAGVAWLSGTQFERAMEQPVSVFRDKAEVRELLARLAEVRRTACLLDRRIDPSAPASLQATQVPLADAFDQVARQVGAETGLIGATVLVGRPAELDRLLTLAALRKDELKAARSIPSARRVQLARDRDLAWQDLDRPADVLAGIGRDWDLAISGAERLPHDLWAAGAAAGVDAAEALSLVLGQYDLTFGWSADGRGIEVIPAPADARVERTHRALALPQAQAIARIRAEWPDVEVVQQGTTLSVTATVKQHEAISRLTGETPPRKAVAPAEPVPLARRRFPVRIVRKPLQDVLQALQAQGIDVVYDAAALRAAGIDLQTLVSVEFASATADELLTALCEPAGLRYEIDGARATILPK
jgi:hypothetical protein